MLQNMHSAAGWRTDADQEQAPAATHVNCAIIRPGKRRRSKDPTIDLAGQQGMRNGKTLLNHPTGSFLRESSGSFPQKTFPSCRSRKKHRIEGSTLDRPTGSTSLPFAVPWQKMNHISSSDRFPLKPTAEERKNLSKWKQLFSPVPGRPRSALWPSPAAFSGAPKRRQRLHQGRLKERGLHGAQQGLRGDCGEVQRLSKLFISQEGA